MRVIGNMFDNEKIEDKSDVFAELFELSKTYSDILITVSGIKHYFGSEPFVIGEKVHLVKEPGNSFDPLAIQVICEGVGKCGYVANSETTVKQGTHRAELIYRGIDEMTSAEVLWAEESFAICKVENLSSFDLVFNSGVELCSEGDAEDALKLFLSLEENRPDELLLQRIADCFFRLDKNEEALQYIEKALKLNQNNQRSLFMRQIIRNQV